MDSVRSLLLLPPTAPVPDFRPDATLLDLTGTNPTGPDGDNDPAVATAVAALLGAGHRVYLHVHPVQTQRVRDGLLTGLVEGVYGVSLPGLVSVEQLRYVDSLLEEAEARAEIAVGLTAIGVWIETARALTLATEIATGSHRLTWLGLNAAALAAELGIEASPAIRAAGAPDAGDAIAYARATVLFAAQAAGLPAVEGLLPPRASSHADPESEIAVAQEVRRAGLRGMLTRLPAVGRRLSSIFPEAPAPLAADEPAHDSD